MRKALKAGSIGVIGIIRRMRARIVTRTLPQHRSFQQTSEDRSAAAKMSIVVPVHDAPQVTRRCFASLEQFAPEAEIIVVNDGSRLAGTIALIQDYACRNDWKVVSNSEATGHSAACKVGAELATRRYLCLLNSDTVVTPWCWHAIQEAFESDPNIGVAGPCTSRSSNRQTLPVAFDCRFDWTDGQICAFAERLTRISLQSSLVDIPWAAGFALFVRLPLWHELNGFDQNLADYGNELEFCKRIAALGYRIVWARRAYIHHLAGQSYGQFITQDEIHERKLAGAQYVRSKHSAKA